MFCDSAQIQIFVIVITLQIVANCRSEAFRRTDCREHLLISGNMAVNKLEDRIQAALVDFCIMICQIQIVPDPEKNAVDFEDMINDSVRILNEQQRIGAELDFKYIIVDEYQDISRQRFDLTKELSKICKAKIIAVGDDWQSIYAFSGSDITLFTKFAEKMGYASLLKITKTYRNSQQVIDIVHDELCKLMGETNARINFPSKPPCIIMMCGLQGAGKTTHAAKLAKYLKGQNRRPMIAACDIYRPAAIKQLQVVGEQAGVPVFEMGQTDAVRIAREAVAFAKDHGNDYVILDTAGRLHIDEELMNLAREGELKAFKHDGFWQCMDAMRDKQQLEALWASGKAPWKSWN